MGFQDNSGDIILDMVLTDYGRQKLAKGQGLGVTQFALGDEEINYRLFDKTAATYQQDLTILQTPVLEAFTNNASSLKSKLSTYTNENLFYLPILKLNTIATGTGLHSTNTFLICVDGNTENNNKETPGEATTALGVNTQGNFRQGVLWGANPGEQSDLYIRVDGGIDNVATLNNNSFNSEKRDDSFIIKMDGRLGKLVSYNGVNTPEPNATDDDGVDTYVISSPPTAIGLGGFSNFISPPNQQSNPSIAGFKHNTLRFKVQTTPNLQSSNYYFDLLGNSGLTVTQANNVNNTNVKFIDSLIHVEGVTTGYSLSIPIRYIKI